MLHNNTNTNEGLVNILNIIENNRNNANDQINNQINNQMNNKTNNHTCIYVSIGSATNKSMVSINNGMISLNPKFEQQFPPFLKKLKEELPFEPLHIILIDKLLELPPFVTWDSEHNQIGQLGIGQLGKDWKEINILKSYGIKTYYNELSNIHVYAVIDYVRYFPELHSNYMGDPTHANINDFIEKLNILSITNNWFTVVNDFSGKNMKDVSVYYDSILGDEIDHIVYGLGARKDGGCYLDVSKPECNFVYIISENEGIKIYNPYKNTNERDIQLVKMINEKSGENQKYARDDEIIKSQLWEYIKFKRKFIMIDLMTLIRQIGMLESNKIEKINGMILKNNYIQNTYHFNFEELIFKNEFKKVLDELISILKIELKSHISVIYQDKTNQIVEKTISEMLECENPYKWYNYVKKLIDNFDEVTGKKINLIED